MQKPAKRRRYSSLLLAVSNACEFLLPLIRGMVLARLLPPAEFGLAISITTVASTVEMISDLGFAQMALRSGTAQSLPTLHTLALVRGIGLALIIAAFGPVFAYLFNAPGTAWVYSLVGLTSFVRSLSHLDPKIRMRTYDYTPEATTIITGQTLWTVFSVIAAILLGDYRAMVIGLLTYAIGSAFVSHVFALRPYSLGWDREIVAESIRYGRPLTLNGVALAITNLGDRFLTGSRIGLEQLAQYTAVATAAFLPRSGVIKFAIALFVPHFVNAVTDEDKRKTADIWIILLSAMGSIFAFAYIAAGRYVVAATFGKHYLIDQNVVSLIAILTCIRYMATIPVAPSMANGKTSFILLNTTLAASGLVLAAILLWFYSSLHVMIMSMIVGEGFGLLFVLRRLRASVGFSPLVMWASVLLPLVMLIGISAAVAGYGQAMPALQWQLCALGMAIDIAIKIALVRYSGSDLSNLKHILMPQRQHHAETTAA